MLPGQTPCASPAVMLLEELPPPPSLVGLGTVRGAGMAVGGNPPTPTAQGIACSQGLVCAEPVLSGSGAAACPQPVTVTSPQRGAAIWPSLQGLRVSEGFSLSSGTRGRPWHVLSIAAGRQLLVVVSPINKSVCPCPWMASVLTVAVCPGFSRTRCSGGGQLAWWVLDDLLFGDGRLWDGRGLLCHSRDGSGQQLVLLWS